MSAPAAAPRVLTFSFTAAMVLAPAQQAAVREALGAWERASGLRLVETPWTDADITIGLGAVTAASPGGFITLDAARWADALLDPGSDGFTRLLQLTGAALGLPPDLPYATVAGPSPDPAAPGLALSAPDVAAVQALFGTPTQEAALDTIWRYDARLDAVRHDSFAETGVLLQGTSGRDMMLGGDGDDALLGGTGHDGFSGGLGNDLIVGGPGLDTLFVGGFRAAAQVDFAAGRVTDAFGTDTFREIERLVFRDGAWALTADTPAALVDRLYQAILLRPADPTGLSTWTAFLEGGAGGAALVERIIGSDEFRLLFGASAAAEEAARQRAAPALAPGANTPLDAPLWVPDAEAVLAVRFHALVTGGPPGRTAFDALMARLEGPGGHLAAADAFLAENPGSAYANGAALLEAAWSLPVIRATAPLVDAGVTLSGDWLF
ncbi:MAG: DUF4214 domain-containing protein [Rubritepida sp.]|nr:DUF4214 domain-containing protein [Rubritepida sp.]